ncbi:MAG: (d)CMP kinase [Moraxella sp.]
MQKKQPIITIDGPSGSGKGTLAYRLAVHLNLPLLDSGALYRIVGLLAYQKGLLTAAPNEDALAQMTQNLSLTFRPNPNTKMVDIYIDNQLFTDNIRTETVGNYASKVALFPKVRNALLMVQQNMKQTGVVADGRDMGTVVFPDADVKIFLTASAESRAKRRVLQLEQLEQAADFDEILNTILLRDKRDKTREVAPLIAASDALEIDSSNLTADEVFNQVVTFCQKKLKF